MNRLLPVLSLTAGLCIGFQGTFAKAAVDSVPPASPPVTKPASPEKSIAADVFHAFTPTEKEAARNDLNAIWAGYRSEVVSVEIDYLFLMWTMKSRKLTADEFFRELHEIPLIADETLTRKLVERFCPESLQGTEEQNQTMLNAIGDQRTFRQQGSEQRCLSKVFEHVVSSDMHLFVDHPNHGIRAYRQGDCKYFFETMDWFRFHPNDTLLGEAEIESDGADLYRLTFFGPSPAHVARTSPSWMTLGRSDGLPRQWQLLNAQNGALLQMESFEELTLYPGDVLCPAIRIKVNLDQGHVSHVRMTIIQRAQFNMPLKEDAFVLSAPARWAWFDWQHEQRAGGRWNQPVANVAKFFKDRTVAVGREPVADARHEPRRSWRSLLLLLNGAVLVVIGIALWRRSA